MKTIKGKRPKDLSAPKVVGARKSIKAKGKIIPAAEEARPPVAPRPSPKSIKRPKAAPSLKVAKPPVAPRRVIDPALLEDVGGLLDDPEGWFRTPNVIFEGRAPVELLGTPEEERLKERIEAARLGLFT